MFSLDVDDTSTFAFAITGNIHSYLANQCSRRPLQAQEETDCFGKGATHLRRDEFFTLYVSTRHRDWKKGKL